ncbi:hypothetical protein [Desulfosediminicola flagellatus]|uniref:hypothetical protein n=1 Tax=Desulfosediminicola flagellatus TaxID=2569541 RepID=UPI0010AD6D4A|nr:hypothetical protein [Desulfosediminicola flagellatus]
MKWLRFYWDFCHKYGGKPEHAENLGKFLDTLTEKNQSRSQRNQARHVDWTNIFFGFKMRFPFGTILRQPYSHTPVAAFGIDHE